MACGGFAVALFAFLAAVYLTVDSTGEPAVQNDFRRRAIIAELALAPIAALVFFTAQAGGAVEMYAELTRWWAPLLLSATSGCAAPALFGLFTARFRLARAAAIGQVTLILTGWSVAQFPSLIVPDVDIFGAAAPEITLRLLAIALAVGAVVLLPSLYYLFRILKTSRPALQVKPADDE